jgi:hypothetical protein
MEACAWVQSGNGNWLIHSMACRFDAKTKDVRTTVCPVTQLERPYTPMVRLVTCCVASCDVQALSFELFIMNVLGIYQTSRPCTRGGTQCAATRGLNKLPQLVVQGRFPHIPPLEPVNTWDTSFGLPWWKDRRYQAREGISPCLPVILPHSRAAGCHRKHSMKKHSISVSEFQSGHDHYFRPFGGTVSAMVLTLGHVLMFVPLLDP